MKMDGQTLAAVLAGLAVVIGAWNSYMWSQVKNMLHDLKDELRKECEETYMRKDVCTARGCLVEEG